MRTQRKLNLEWMLKDLPDDELISQAQYDDLVSKAGAHRRKNIPPLVSVAETHWLSATRPRYPLGLVSEWKNERPATRFCRNQVVFPQIPPEGLERVALKLVGFSYGTDDTKNIGTGTA